jgi:hypothetical protein
VIFSQVTRDRDGPVADVPVWVTFPRNGVWQQNAYANPPPLLATNQFQTGAEQNPNNLVANNVRTLALGLNAIPNTQIEFVKCLGWGGMGVASLFWYPGPNNTRILCVFKCALHRGFERHLEREKKIQEKFTRAMHIVQTVPPIPSPALRRSARLNPPAPAPGAPPAGAGVGAVPGGLFAPLAMPVNLTLDNLASPVPGKPGPFTEQHLPAATLVTEYCQRKSLHAILSHVGYQWHNGGGCTVPEEMLWAMFRCSTWTRERPEV